MASVLYYASWMVVVLLVGARPSCRGEFTVVVPDTSAAALVDAPQTGFSDRARTDPAEQRAVQEVMAATGNGWASAIADVCRGRWHGIECVPDRGDVYHVMSLSFGALSDDTAFPACDAASATLSPAVLALPHLRSLFFYRCFSGNPQPIPAFLGRLGPAFRSLVLRENGHVGPIPAELGNLSGLRVLDLHGNHLTSAIPATVQSLTSLQLLDLSYNRLAGQVPHFKFQHLSILDLSHNAMQDRVPASLGQCRSLLKIDLSQNRLAGTIPDALGDLPDLILLDLSHNALSGPIPAALGRLSSLRSLILSDNRMQFSTIPGNFFTGLKALTTLALSGMGLEGSMPESIGQLGQLRVLRLDSNEFTGVIPASFRRLERASEFRVDGNRLVGPIPFDKEMMWRLGKKLRVGGNEGLCYDAKQEGLEGVVALAGVADCDSVRSRTTQHLGLTNSGGRGRGGAVANVSSSAASGCNAVAVCVGSWHIFLGVLVFLQLAWLDVGLWRLVNRGTSLGPAASHSVLVVPTKQEPVRDRRKRSRGREARRCSSSRGGLGSSLSGWVRTLHPPPSTRRPWNEARASLRPSRSSRTCGRSSTRPTSTARSRTSTASRSRYCE